MDITNYKKNIKSLGAAQALNFIFPIAIFPILSHHLSVEKLGEIISSYTLATTSSIIIDFGFNFEGTRKAALWKYDKRLTTLFINVTLIKCVLALLTGFLCVGYYLFTKQSEIDILLHAAIITPILISSAISPQWVLHGLSKLQTSVYISSLARLSAIMIYIFEDTDSSYAAACLLTAPQLITSILAIIITNEIKIFKRLYYKIENTNQILKENIPVFLSNIATLPYTQGGIILLAAIHSPVEVAIYSAAEKLIKSILSVQSVFSQAAYPIACENPNANIRKIILAILYTISTITIAILLFSNRWLLEKIYGTEYVLASKTLLILSLILLSNPIALMTAHLGLLATGNGKSTFKAYGLTSLTFLLISPPLVIKYGSVGAAIATFFCEALATLLLMYELKSINKNKQITGA